jgi:AmmeMemoRadiSam system protein B
MSTIRPTAVAGMFYPADRDELHQMVTGFLSEAAPADEPAPKAIIAPHAGYIYSGPIAASAYARLARVRDTIRRVVLLGPSHRVGFLGIAASGADYFHTPLGDVPLDHEQLERVTQISGVQQFDQAHQMEHSLEVHLPFLQEVLGDFTLLPLVVGDASPEDVAEVLRAVWGGEETLIVVSSDLSHYHDYATAQRMDRSTSSAIEQLNPKAIGYEDACGRTPLSGLLLVAKEKHLNAETIDLRNSGDTAGPRDQVVGYGAYLFH